MISSRKAVWLLLLVGLASITMSACTKEKTSTELATSTAPSGQTQTEAPATAPAAPPAVSSRDVCAMLTADELKPIIGEPDAGTKARSGGADVCTWWGKTGKAAIVQVYGSVSAYEDSREAFEDLYDKKAEGLAGVGDKAFFILASTGPVATGTISATKGNSAISAQVMGGGDPGTLKNDTTALARLVLDKL